MTTLELADDRGVAVLFYTEGAAHILTYLRMRYTQCRLHCREVAAELEPITPPWERRDPAAAS